MKAKYIRGHIMLRKEFSEDILSGRKTTTIRLGKIVPKTHEIMIHSGGRPIAKALIKKVVYKHIYELSEEDAKKDGYESIEELVKSLENLYGRPIDMNEIVTIIEFEVIKKFTELDEKDVYMGLTPLEIAMISNRYLRDELSENDFRIIDAILRYKSIRAVSLKLYGSLSKRWLIRKVLRKCLYRLMRKNVVKIRNTAIEM